MQQQSDPKNSKTQPPPRFIHPQRSPRFLEAEYPKMKEAVFQGWKIQAKKSWRNGKRQRTTLEAERVSDH